MRLKMFIAALGSESQDEILRLLDRGYYYFMTRVFQLVYCSIADSEDLL